MSVMSPEAAQLIHKQSEGLVAAATLHHALINNYTIEVFITPATIPPGSINPGADTEVVKITTDTLRARLRDATENAVNYHVGMIADALEDNDDELEVDDD